jgi:hypothetical protein
MTFFHFRRHFRAEEKYSPEEGSIFPKHWHLSMSVHGAKTQKNIIISSSSFPSSSSSSLS